MSENDTPQEILKNNSSSLMVTTTTTAAAAAIANTITDECKNVKMDHFNLKLHNSSIENVTVSIFT